MSAALPKLTSPLHEQAPEVSEYIMPSVRCSSIWMATDFTAENGATMIMPGSHLSGRHPTAEEGANSGRHLGAIPLVAPAGSCALYDGRLWHQVGANLGTSVDGVSGRPWRLGAFYHYCTPTLRSQEHIALTTARDVSNAASPRVRELLGLRPWHGYGRVGMGTASPAGIAAHGLPESGLVYRTRADSDGALAAVSPVQPAQPSAEPPQPSAGLFLGDYSQLPAPSQEPERLRDDLDTYGYCMVAAALDATQVRALRSRLLDQAAAEAEAGVGSATASELDPVPPWRRVRLARHNVLCSAVVCTLCVSCSQTVCGNSASAAA